MLFRSLIDRFDFVSGTELDLMRQDKPSIIRHGVEAIGLDPAHVDAVTVGDRKEDILGGQHYGYRAIGVSWGYADPGELESVNPTAIASDVDELRALLGF